MAITGGSVTFEQSRKLADYENRKATITFNVNTDDGEDATAQVIRALELAEHHVHVALGLKKQTDFQPKANAEATKASAGTKSADDAKKAVADKLNAEDEAKKPATRTRKAKAPPAEVVDEDPTTMPEDDLSGIGEDVPDKAPKAEEDLSAMGDGWAAGPEEVTDKDLQDACAKKNAEIKNPIAIRTLIGKFVNPGQSLADIPAASRAKFLDDLAGL